MAARFQAAGSGVTASASTISVAWPTHQIGDLGILVVATAYTSAPTPSGWTAIVVDSSLGYTLGIYYAFATSSAMGNATAGQSGRRNNGFIFTIRGANGPGSPIGNSSMYSLAAAASGWQTQAGSISANGKSCLVCVAGTAGGLTTNDAIGGWAAGLGVGLSGTLTERQDYTAGGYGIAAGTANLVGGASTVNASVYLNNSPVDLYEYEFLVNHGSEGNFFSLL